MTTPVPEDTAKAQALIPGAFEPRPVTPRKSGGMSGRASGELDPPEGPSTMDEATTAQQRRAGGGRR